MERSTSVVARRGMWFVFLRRPSIVSWTCKCQRMGNVSVVVFPFSAPPAFGGLLADGSLCVCSLLEQTSEDGG